MGGKGGGEAPDIPIVHRELVFLGWGGHLSGRRSLKGGQGPCAELVASKTGWEGQEDALSGSETPGRREQVDRRVAQC